MMSVSSIFTAGYCAELNGAAFFGRKSRALFEKTEFSFAQYRHLLFIFMNTTEYM